MSEQQDKEYKNTTYEFSARCLVKGFTMPSESEYIYCKCSVLAGSNPDGSQRYLNSSLIVSDRVKLAKSLLNIDLNNTPMILTIGGFYCNPKLDSESNQIWEDYRGFLNGITIGSLPIVPRKY